MNITEMNHRENVVGKPERKKSFTELGVAGGIILIWILK
jgi:hypothetical protein